MDKTIATWQPGKSSHHNVLVNGQRSFEETKVQAGPDEQPICVAKNIGAAIWISHRLNVAADLERLLILFAEGQSDGKELEKYVTRLRS